VTAHRTYDARPYAALGAGGLRARLRDLEHERSNDQQPTPEEQLTATARAIQADITEGRLVIHEQLRDPDGTLRALASDALTGQGVLLHGEGDLRYIEGRHADTRRASDSFDYIRRDVMRHAQRRAPAPTTRRPQPRPQPERSRQLPWYLTGRSRQSAPAAPTARRGALPPTPPPAGPSRSQPLTPSSATYG